MSLLTLVANAAEELNLPTPSVVITATDQTTITMAALANREGKDLASRGQWQALTKEATFTTVAAELQGTLADLAIDDFKYMLGETIWIRDLIEPIGGGISPQTWQMYKATNITGPYPKFRIINKSLYMIPAPAAGQTAAFEYMSGNWCQSSGGTGQSAWEADTDTGILDEDLMTLGLKWRFLRSKGFDYAEEFATYESRVNDALARDSTPQRLTLASRRSRSWTPRPNDGSWSIT